MLSLLIKTSRSTSIQLCRNRTTLKFRPFTSIFSSLLSESSNPPNPNPNPNTPIFNFNCSFPSKKNDGFSSFSHDKLNFLSGSFSGGDVRFLSSQAGAAVEEPSTSDGLTVEGIIGNNWCILDESESDWKSHASSIAQSIQLIKKRLKVCL